MMQLSRFVVQRLRFPCSGFRPSAADFKIHRLTGKKRYPLPSSVYVKLMDGVVFFTYSLFVCV
jgi:hypothetical protein